MSDDGLLGRAELERAFAALGIGLSGGVVVDLFVVGGEPYRATCVRF
jgi:hypothetical protein